MDEKKKRRYQHNEAKLDKTRSVGYKKCVIKAKVVQERVVEPIQNRGLRDGGHVL